LVGRDLVCFRDFSATHASGQGTAPALWDRLRVSAAAQSLLAGANATVAGKLLAALYRPIWTSAIDSAKSLALALILFAGLQIWKIAPWILVVIGATIGGIFL
jgi:chromate transporter